MVGETLEHLQQRLQTDFLELIERYSQMPDSFLAMFDNIVQQVLSDHFFVDGKSNLFNYVDAHNSSNLKYLYSLFDSDHYLAKLLEFDDDRTVDESSPIRVHLGYELDPQALGNYSLITARYGVDEYGQGTIALLGPTNMPYSQLIGLIASLSQELAKQLNDYFNELNGNSS